MNSNKSITLLFISLVLCSSCASSTIIDSYPSNAIIYINGEKVGKTPYKHRDSKIVGGTNTVRIEKNNYKTYRTSFSKNEKLAVGPLIGGIFLLVPYLWIMKYEKARVYDLIPEKK